MRHALISSVVGFAVVCTNITGVASTSATSGAALQSATRTLYVSVVDKTGSPITDLQAADFEVKEGGKVQSISGVKLATTPLHIAIIDSDAGTGYFQAAIATLMKKLLGHAEFALVSLVPQPQRLVNYSGDGAVLSEGLNRLGKRGVQRDAQIMEAIQDSIKDVAAEGKRPVIVVMRVGAEATSTLSGNTVREQLRKTGAILDVTSTLTADSSTGATSDSSSGSGGKTEQSQLHNDESAESATNLSQVLSDGSQESGGHHDRVAVTTVVATLDRLAEELLHQYEITYAVPAGAKAGDKLAVSSKRKGVTVHAPARLPN